MADTFNIGIVVRIQLFHAGDGFTLRIEQVARTLRAFGSDREFSVRVFFDEIVLVCGHDNPPSALVEHALENWDGKLLANLRLIGVGHAAGLSDCLVFVCVPVKEQADLAQIVARLQRVVVFLTARVGDFVLEVGLLRIDFFDLVPGPL